MARIAIIALLLLATSPALAEPAQPERRRQLPLRRRMPLRRQPTRSRRAGGAERRHAAGRRALRPRMPICANPCA